MQVLRDVTEAALQEIQVQPAILAAEILDRGIVAAKTQGQGILDHVIEDPETPRPATPLLVNPFRAETALHLVIQLLEAPMFHHDATHSRHGIVIRPDRRTYHPDMIHFRRETVLRPDLRSFHQDKTAAPLRVIIQLLMAHAHHVIISIVLIVIPVIYLPVIGRHVTRHRRVLIARRQELILSAMAARIVDIPATIAAPQDDWVAMWILVGDAQPIFQARRELQADPLKPVGRSAALLTIFSPGRVRAGSTLEALLYVAE